VKESFEILLILLIKFSLRLFSYTKRKSLEVKARL